MVEKHPRRTPRQGRARKRAIRAQAALTGVRYSVAARQLEASGLRPGETVAGSGRTIYPFTGDEQRQRLIEARARWSFEERLDDTRRAALLPDGRAQHLVERFPSTGSLYHGEDRAELLSMLYMAVVFESPALLPEPGFLAWVAEMGEETTVDMECAALDRAARALLDREPDELWPVLERAVAASRDGADWHMRQVGIRLAALSQVLWAAHPEAPVAGVAQTLDAVLMVADDGHAPGTQVRLLTGPYQGLRAMIVGAVWGAAGPPVAYRVRRERSGHTLTMAPHDLVVLAGQELLPH
ncbi:hypothetical protein GCM10010112_22130 [Actinoplanes lobatus]|uniref:Uncharacterized protein n=1 Tax=Actinoplanes lobatus TaxID=113568 RepID=A0A7W7HIN6_9ACTN|nr:hypothetical protein [Actinoplanes lobatus]MBB4751256.1 hypothetical protein [Actinoplanes lobatus]GGN63159.1 hypothetical protein GCM10010112_22130 [Actinoplanes lobatus]GIE44802.1 hypothetical protein Alo02nite_77000 [Actinoplanes lobatus]